MNTISKRNLNLNKKVFYSLLILLFLIIALHSTIYLIQSYLLKQEAISNSDFVLATTVQKNWSLAAFWATLSSFIIFFICILLGRKKVAYGYVFHLFWIILIILGMVFLWQIKNYYLWQKIIFVVLLFGLVAIMVYSTYLLYAHRELLKLETQQNYYNKKIKNSKRIIKAPEINENLITYKIDVKEKMNQLVNKHHE